ncbi:hypothetical protein VV02_24090 [Luteipulveratus mongoliensis]|uniref:Uncharacterized protein n=2 Tax=Luteipulveratus mongoliensis TaxID=571913 RepID=A0A0K1JNC4_9MICO|nr:hypothetical protein VV02_24090 [Luteipulveratus mongoliensis]
MVSARAQGSPVEVEDLRAEFTSTWANPDGTLTTKASTGQLRFRDKSGSWKNVDLAIKEQDGALVADSTPEQISLAGPLKSASKVAKAAGAGSGSDAVGASVGSDRQVLLGWAKKLGKPVVSGSAVTYADATPGVDLRIQMTRSGYETFFVVKDKSALAASVADGGPAKGRVAFEVPVKTKGLTARSEKDGSVSFIGKKDKVVSRLVAPEAWDATLDKASGLPAAHTPVRLDVEQKGKGTATVTVSIDAKWATDTARQFPLTIDPSYATTNVAPSLDTRVQTDGGNVDYSTDNELRVGTYAVGAPVARSFLNFPLAGISGKQVQAASLSLYETYSSSCSARRMNVVKSTAASTATRWNNQPTLSGVAGYATFAKGNSSSCPAARQSIAVTQLAKDWAASGSSGSVALQAADESDTYGWKRFASSETATPPYLSVTYNRPPNAAAAPTFLATGGAQGIGYVRGARVTFTTKVTDPDASRAKAWIEVHSNTTGNNRLGYCDTSVAASASSVSCVPAVDLPEGATSYVRARGTDELGLGGPWSGWTKIRRASYAPQPATVSCPGYANGTWSDTAPAADVTCTIATTQTNIYSATRVDVYVDGAATPTKSVSSYTQATSQTVTFPKTANGGHQIRVVAVGPSLLSTTTTSAFGWGNASLTSPVPLSTTSGKMTFSAVGPPKGGASSVTAKVRWRVAGQGGNETTGWTDGGTLPVTFGAGGMAQASGAWDTQLATTDSAGIAIPARTPVLLDVQVCLDYSGAQQCTWSQSATSISRVPHAFGDGFPTQDAGPGQVAQFTGEFSMSETDGTAPALSGDLSVSRSHLSFTGDGTLTGWPSADLANSVFGPGWTASWDGPEAGTASMNLVDNTRVDGTMVLLDDDGGALVFQQPGDTRVAAKAGTYEPATQDTIDEGMKLVVSGTGTAARVVVTEEDGTATTYSPVTTPATGAWTWSPLQVAEPGAAGTTSYTRDTSGRITRILAGLPDGMTAADCPTTGTMQAGCRALNITYATATTATSTTPGDVAGQVKSISTTLWDPATSAMKTTTIATYAYDSSKRMVKATDGLTNLTTGYTWDGTSTRVASVTPPGQAAYRISYSTDGGKGSRVKQVTRDPAESGGSSSALASFVYDMDPAELGSPELTATKVGTWYQKSAPTKGFAMFGPEHPVSSTTSVGLDDWQYADLAYTDDQGYTVNTASYGAGQWLINATDYDAKGNTIRGFTPEAIGSVQALGAPSPEIADTFSSQTVYNEDIKNSAGVVTVPAGTLVTDSLTPVREMTLPDGRVITARIKSHTTYDEGAPNGNVNPATSGPYNLATTVRTTVLGSDIGPGGSGDVELSKTTNGYDPVVTGDTSGWDLGNPTSVTQGGTAVVTRYDPSGRVIETRQPAATSTASAGTTRTVYYTAGANSVDPACGGTANAKAWAGSPCRVFPGAAPSAGPVLPDTRSTGYDMWLNSTSEVETAGSVTRTTTSRYDTAGRKVFEQTTANIPGSTALPATFTKFNATTGLVDYEGNANAAGTDATTQRTTTTYDGWGRAVSYTNDQGETTTTSYNAAGQVGSVTDPKGTKTFTYDGTDAAGKTERRGAATKVVISRAGTGGALTFTGAYDRAGALTRQDLPGQVTATTDTNILGQEVGMSYEGQVTPVTASTDPETGDTTWTPGTPTRGDWLGWSIDRDGLGRMAREYTGSGAAFDPSLGEAEPGATGTQPVGSAQAYDRAYTYDEAGRLTKVIDRTAAVSVGPVTPDTPSSVIGQCQVREYGYAGDPGKNGARTSWKITGYLGDQCGSGTPVGALDASHSYDTADRLTTGMSVNGGPAGGAYVYDAFGRQTTIPGADAPDRSGQDVTLGYYDNDLPKAVAEGTTSTQFALDAGGRRSTQTTTTSAGTATAVRHYTDDSDNPGWVVNTPASGGAATTTRFVEGISSELGAMITDTGEANISLSNPHGDNVTAVTIPADTSGDTACAGITGWEDATEYGGPALSDISTNRDPSVVGPLGYGWLGASQRSTTVETAGLTLMGVRYYNWVTGAFTGPDPVPGGNDTSYGYPNDPINSNDTTGEINAIERGGGTSATWNWNWKPKKKRCGLGCRIHSVARKTVRSVRRAVPRPVKRVVVRAGYRAVSGGYRAALWANRSHCTWMEGMRVCRGGRFRLWGRGGTTIGGVYATDWNPQHWTSARLRHEKVHRRQWRRYGLWFGYMYLRAGSNPCRNKWERRAGLIDGGYPC